MPPNETKSDSGVTPGTQSNQNKKNADPRDDVSEIFSPEPPEKDKTMLGKEVEDLDADQRYREPLWFCKTLTERPKLWFGLTLSWHFLVMLVTGMMVFRGYDILTLSFDQLPLQILDHTDFLRAKAWEFASSAPEILTHKSSGNVSERSETMEIITLYFEIPGGNVYTKENLKLIKETEENFLNNSDFQQFCQLENNSTCRASFSILRYFDGTYKDEDPIFEDPDFNNIPQVLEKANSLAKTKKEFQYFLGKNAVVNASTNTAESSITRSFIYIGSPLSGYSNGSDREDEQDEKSKKFQEDSFQKMADALFETGIGQMRFYYFSGSLMGSYITSQVMFDMLMAVGSATFIFIFMWTTTQSLWITGWAVFSIITNFLTTNLIYRVVLDYKYLGPFHVLAIFIILGIGADDVFVFFDTWKISSHKHYNTLAQRLSHVYRKASVAMFFTSITTATAFLISASSPLLGVNSFGVFSGILVLVNYISVITFLPAVVVNHHYSWEKCKWCCCICCNKTRTNSVGDMQYTGSAPGSPVSVARIEDGHRHSPIVRFFKGPYYNFVTNKVAKWLILVFFVSILAVAIYFATQLKPNEEETKFLPDDSNFAIARDRSTHAFKPSGGDRNVKVHIVWGIKTQDLSSCHKTDYECPGVTVWDDDFDLNSIPVQLELQNFCNMIKNMTVEQASKLKIKPNIVTGEWEVECFVEDLADFLKNEGSHVHSFTNTAIYPPGTDLSYPFDQNKSKIVMQSIPFIFDPTKISNTSDRYIETALSLWLMNGFEPPFFGSAYRKYGSYFGQGETANTVTKELSLGGLEATFYYGTRLRYAAIKINTTVLGTTLGYPEGLPIRDAWEEWTNAEMAKLSKPLRGGWQMSKQIWHWLQVQKVLTSTAINGILIGIGVAFPILIFATMNLLTGFYALISISCVTVSVIGVIPMAGWKLGVLESLNLVLVVGLAVDYTVHLAEGYSRSRHKERLSRVKDMLEEVGISVLSGACTTLGASLFMLLAQIIFFQQFGIFMFATVGFSILYALGLFTILLVLFGPQNDFASLKPLFRKCCKKNENEAAQAQVTNANIA